MKKLIYDVDPEYEDQHATAVVKIITTYVAKKDVDGALDWYIKTQKTESESVELDDSR